MPEVKIVIGKREFEVACQPGEEQYLESAARLLDIEATALLGQFGRMADAKLLLMAGLMLADKTAGLEDRVKKLGAAEKSAQSELETLKSSPPAAERVEVPVVPSALVQTMAELTARAEALADQVDDKLAG